jgi:hypothetical protein
LLPTQKLHVKEALRIYINEGKMLKYVVLALVCLPILNTYSHANAYSVASVFLVPKNVVQIEISFEEVTKLEARGGGRGGGKSLRGRTRGKARS